MEDLPVEDPALTSGNRVVTAIVQFWASSPLIILGT